MTINSGLWIRVNGMVYQLENATLNGRPLVDLSGLRQPGRLSFLAVPPRGGYPTFLRVALNASEQRSTIGGFKSVSGLSTEVEVVESRRPDEAVVMTGRTISVTGLSGGTVQVNMQADGKYVVKKLAGRPQ